MEFRGIKTPEFPHGSKCVKLSFPRTFHFRAAGRDRLFNLFVHRAVGDRILLFPHFLLGSENPGTRIGKTVNRQLTFLTSFHSHYPSGSVTFRGRLSTVGEPRRKPRPQPLSSHSAAFSADSLLTYSSHSKGSRYFLRLLHSLHAGATLPREDFPPRMSATMWSIVSSGGEFSCGNSNIRPWRFGASTTATREASPLFPFPSEAARAPRK